MRVCLSSLMLVSLLAGCGGGGGGGDASPSTTPTGGTPSVSENPSAPPPPRYSSISGIAAKGIIGNARITAYDIGDDGSRGAMLGVAQTGIDGKFTLEILAQSTPVWLELSGGTGAFMLCDSLDGCGETSNTTYDANQNGQVDFGEKMALPPGFGLRALVPAAEDNSVSANISLLTHMAAAYAETFPQGIDGLSIAMANSQTANLFALDGDVLTTTVPDVSQIDRYQAATQTQRKYALILGGFSALAQNGEIVSLLQQAVTQFSGQQGQLANHSDDAMTLSLSAWAEKSRLLAVHLNDSLLAAAFANLKNAADIASDINTHASPDRNISSNELKTTKALITQIHDLKGTIDLSTLESPLPTYAGLLDASTSVLDNSNAMTRASKLGAFVATPKMGLEAACNSISNFFTAYLCRSIIASKSLDEICTMTLSNLNIGGKTLCQYLNALRLPAGNGLVTELALMDGVAKVEGSRNGTTVDMQLSNGVVNTSENNITMDWSGYVDNDDFNLNITQGDIRFAFNDLGTVAGLNHPHNIDSDVNAQLALKLDQISRFDGSSKTSVDLADEDNPVTTTQLTGQFVDSSGVPSTINLGMALNQSVGTTLSANFTHPQTGKQVTLTLARTESGDNLRMQWEGTKINMATNRSDQTVTLDNGGAVQISLNLQNPDAASLGSITYNGKPYGSVLMSNNELLVQLPNGQTAYLF